MFDYQSIQQEAQSQLNLYKGSDLPLYFTFRKYITEIINGQPPRNSRQYRSSRGGYIHYYPFHLSSTDMTQYYIAWVFEDRRPIILNLGKV